MQKINKFFTNMGLQIKLIASFFVMALLVFFVALFGSIGTFQLSEQLNEISIVRLPSISGLQMIDNGIRDIQAGELALLNTRLNEAVRQEELEREKLALQQIKEGFAKYEPLPRTPKEDKLWKGFLSKFERWKQEHEIFVSLYQDFEKMGMISPFKKQLKLWQSGLQKSPQFEQATAAGVLLQQMNIQVFTIIKPTFNATTKALQKVLDENEKIAEDARKKAEISMASTQKFVILGMSLGPAIAVTLGVILSIAIAKPLDQNLRELIRSIVASSTQISAVVEEQERITTQQAYSVNETTTTMDELSAASHQASEQADLVFAGTQQTLNLAQSGTKAVEQTLEGMTILQKKVGAISKQIMRLSEQTYHINSITNLVTELANQTNLLALNAAVEAVRSGEHGKGFGVVATEIRKLSDRSKASSEKIKGLIADIQNAIDATVMATEEATKTLKTSMTLSQETATAFSGVTNAIDQVVGSAQQISLMSKQHAIAIQQILEAMNNINNGAQQSAEGMSETKSGLLKMQNVTHKLKSLGIG
jgi:methyl-accepting chemotaxis protein